MSQEISDADYLQAFGVTQEEPIRSRLLFIADKLRFEQPAQKANVSEEISDEAWERAARLESYHFSDIDEQGGRNVLVDGPTEDCQFYISREEALAAQAELYAADEVTDAEAIAFYERYHDGPYFDENDTRSARHVKFVELQDIRVALKDAYRLRRT